MTEAQRLAARIETENYEAASMIWRLEAEGSSLCEQNSMLDAKLAELEAECEQLKADLIEQCKIIGGSAETELLLRAECEALRKDAERLREHAVTLANTTYLTTLELCAKLCESHFNHEAKDCAEEIRALAGEPIDAAMGKEIGND
jgi:peptidoglycan hydrolase CwlO-like protein